MSQERFVAFRPPLKPTSGVDVVANDAAAAKAREAIKKSFSNSEDALARAQGSPTQEQTTPSRLTKQLLQFPQNVPNGRDTPSHYIIFDRIKLSPGKGSQDDKSITLKGKTKTSIAQIALYMPASVDVGYKSQYADTAVGAGAELGASIATSIKNIATSKEGLIAAATEQVPRITTALGKAGGDMANQFALDALTSVVGILPGMGGLAEVAQLKANKVVTDKMELFFKGVGRREFQYEFTFIPTSKEDCKVVNDIVNEFKLALLL